MKNISIGLIGLGKMGGNLGLNLMEKGWSVIGYNRSPDKSKLLEKQGLKVVYSIDALVSSLSGTRVLWLMVPQGKPVDDTIESLLPYLNEGDIIIDGGNSKYTESIARYKELKKESRICGYWH